MLEKVSVIWCNLFSGLFSSIRIDIRGESEPHKKRDSSNRLYGVCA